MTLTTEAADAIRSIIREELLALVKGLSVKVDITAGHGDEGVYWVTTTDIDHEHLRRTRAAATVPK